MDKPASKLLSTHTCGLVIYKKLKWEMWLKFRLEDLDAMGKVCQAPQGESFEMILPEAHHYSDLHGGSNVPAIPMTRLENFLLSNGKQLDGKIKQLYEQRFVFYILFFYICNI